MAIVGLLKLNVQLLCGSEPAIGPGKALVLDAIERTGSISAAGRDLGMSYRRIWLLVDSLNRCWADAVVDTHIGGGAARGARLTEFGRSVLRAYQDLESKMIAAAEGDSFNWLQSVIRPSPVESPSAHN